MKRNNIGVFSLIFSIGLIIQTVSAQTVFIKSAKITFEKKVNIKEELANNTWLNDEAKEKMGKYRTTNWEYSFNDSSSIYRAKPKESLSDNAFFFASDNTDELFTDFAKNNRVKRKSIMGDDFILKDSIPRLKWKIMHDLRKIAGYECRKAIATINDTVTVVAFYTDEILTKGGPEGFTGLPGMILGLAIPRYNTTWFASKIEARNVPILNISPPNKGRKTDSEKDFKKLMDLYTRYDDKAKPKSVEEVRKALLNYFL